MTEKCERYFKKNKYGQEVFDYRAYEDDEQMRILSQMSQATQTLNGHCLAFHNSFLRKNKSSTTHTR